MKMSNIYKHFNDNDMDMDIAKITSINVELDDITKKRIRNQLRTSVTTKKNKPLVKTLIAVASIFLIFFSISVLSKDSITAFAENIPLLNSLFQNYSSSIGGDFQDYTQVIGETKKDKGYEVTLDEVVMDEFSFKLIYTIKCPEKVSTLIGKEGSPFPHTPGKSIKLDDKDFIGGASGSHKIIDDYTVQVVEDYDITKSNIPNNFNLEIDIKEVNGLTGDWKFSLHSSKEKISKDIKNFTPNKEVKMQTSNGKEVTLTFKSVSFSPISTAIQVETNEDFDYYNLIFKDADGNIIKSTGGSLSAHNGLLGYEGKGLYKFEPMDKIPEKIFVEYKTNDIAQVQVAELNFN
jgi:hypothetical protein